MYAKTPIFEVRRHREKVVVTPRRNLSEFEFQQIENELRGLASDPDVVRVLVDFGRTDYCGSTALGMLMWLTRVLRERGGSLTLCNLSTHEREILKLTGLADTWPIANSPSPEAIAGVLHSCG